MDSHNKKISDRIYRIDWIERTSAKGISPAAGGKNPINPVNPVEINSCFTGIRICWDTNLYRRGLFPNNLQIRLWKSYLRSGNGSTKKHIIIHCQDLVQSAAIINLSTTLIICPSSGIIQKYVWQKPLNRNLNCAKGLKMPLSQLKESRSSSLKAGFLFDLNHKGQR